MVWRGISELSALYSVLLWFSKNFHSKLEKGDSDVVNFMMVTYLKYGVYFYSNIWRQFVISKFSEILWIFFSEFVKFTWFHYMKIKVVYLVNLMNISMKVFPGRLFRETGKIIKFYSSFAREKVIFNS